MNTHQVQKMPVHTHTRKRECTPWDARNGKKKAKFASNAASHDTWKEQKRRRSYVDSENEFNQWGKVIEGLGFYRTTVMGYHLSTHTFYATFQSPLIQIHYYFTSEVILEPHLQILREYVRNRRNSPWGATNLTNYIIRPNSKLSGRI